MSGVEKTVERVEHWLESVVIGLNFCPFAESVLRQQKIKFALSSARDIDGLIFELYEQISLLQENSEFETTLLIIPSLLVDFDDYNDSLDLVDDLLQINDWTGEFQVASFHPHYQFEGTQPDDRENWTNRSPYPIYHILRERSVTKAIQNHPAADQIPAANIRTLKSLEQSSFEQLFSTDFDN